MDTDLAENVIEHTHEVLHSFDTNCFEYLKRRRVGMEGTADRETRCWETVDRCELEMNSCALRPLPF